MCVSGVTFEVPLRRMHCDGLHVSSQLIIIKLQVSRENDYGENQYRLGRTNTGTVVHKQPEKNIIMHVPQSAASDNVQQNETCIVTSLNTDNTDQFIKKKKMFWREKLI